MIFNARIGVEPKESFGDGGGEGHVPDGLAIGSALFDMLADWTKHEASLPFRVVSLAFDQEGAPE